MNTLTYFWTTAENVKLICRVKFKVSKMHNNLKTRNVLCTKEEVYIMSSLGFTFQSRKYIHLLTISNRSARQKYKAKSPIFVLFLNENVVLMKIWKWLFDIYHVSFIVVRHKARDINIFNVGGQLSWPYYIKVLLSNSGHVNYKMMGDLYFVARCRMLCLMLSYSVHACLCHVHRSSRDRKTKYYRNNLTAIFSS